MSGLPPAEEIREVANEVVGQSGYELQVYRPVFEETVWQELIEWMQPKVQVVGEWVWRVLEWFAGISGPAQGERWSGEPWLPIAWLLVGLVSLLFIGLLVHLLFLVARALKPSGQPGNGPSSTARFTTPEELESLAARSASGRNYMDAVRAVLKASLLRVETLRGKKALQPYLTDREYLQVFRESRIHEALASIVEVMDSRWYGGVACSREDFAACEEAYVRICERVEELSHARRA